MPLTNNCNDNKNPEEGDSLVCWVAANIQFEALSFQNKWGMYIRKYGFTWGRRGSSQRIGRRAMVQESWEIPSSSYGVVATHTDLLEVKLVNASALIGKGFLSSSHSQELLPADGCWGRKSHFLWRCGHLQVAYAPLDVPTPCAHSQH